MLLIQISIQPVFRQQPEMKRNLIPVLLKSRRITPDIITQYCRSATAFLLFFFFFSFLSHSCSEIHLVLPPCCSAFGLDHSSVINQYITTLLLQEESEDVAGDLGAEQEEAEPLGHADALERVLQLLPSLHSSRELTDSLCAAISKVSTLEGKPDNAR